MSVHRNSEAWRENQEAYVARLERERREKQALDARRQSNDAPEPECVVCKRDDRAAIEEKIRAGTDDGVIAEFFGLDRESVWLHGQTHEMSCLVCPHPDRAAIEAKMRAGLQLGRIVELFAQVDGASVKIHRDRHLTSNHF
jgi:hypothetical protein